MPTVSILGHACSVQPKARTLRPLLPQVAAEVGLLLDADGSLADPTPAHLALRRRFEEHASARWPGPPWRWEALRGTSLQVALGHLPVHLPVSLIALLQERAGDAGLTMDEMVRRALVGALSPRA